jgi:eukaryotic-like serine/threonine-protein kinase
MQSAPPCPACGYVSHTPPSGDTPPLAGATSECPRCGAVLRSSGPGTSTGEDPTPPPFEAPSAVTDHPPASPDDSGPQAPSKAPSATVLGDYRLVRKLGEGAMGAVYKAKQISQNGRNVALKVLFRHVAKKPRCVERFYREARVMMQLDHPHIVRGYAVGEEQGLHFFAMEYVSGCSLQHWINRHGPLGVGEALHVALAIARALGYAHGRDLIHRDVKPDNVLLGFPPRSTTPRPGGGGPGGDPRAPFLGGVVPVQIKITDLGMAKVLDDALDLTQTGYGVGTPCYMPLEQARNSKEVDGRCDIYALGCVLYCVLTGQPPFTGPTLIDLVQAKEVNNFRPARRFNSEVPQRLDLIIYRMVAKLPRDRHQTCAELIRDLESLRLAHPNLCLPRPEVAPVRPGPGAESGSGSGDPTPPTPERVSAADVKTRVVQVGDGVPASDSNDQAATAEQARARERSPSAPVNDVWHLRFRTPLGKYVKRTLTTTQVLDLIASEAFDPTTQASRHPESGFKALANFREFRAAVLPRVTKAGADDRTNRLRSLARQALDAKEPGTGSRSGSGERADKAAQPAGLPLTWQKLLLIGGGLVLLAGLVVLVLKLLDIFG